MAGRDMSNLRIPGVEPLTPWSEPGVLRAISRLKSGLEDITDVAGLRRLRDMLRNKNVIHVKVTIQGIELEMRADAPTVRRIEDRIGELTK